MRKFLLLLCIPFIGIAQTDYELAFNSATSDYVEMTNASSVIANKTAFSMSCWVYPEANTNHGGIIGVLEIIQMLIFIFCNCRTLIILKLGLETQVA